jgi:hypothetical protein
MTAATIVTTAMIAATIVATAMIAAAMIATAMIAAAMIAIMVLAAANAMPNSSSTTMNIGHVSIITTCLGRKICKTENYRGKHGNTHHSLFHNVSLCLKFKTCTKSKNTTDTIT